MKKTKLVTQYVGNKPVATYRSMSVAAELSDARPNHISEVISGDRNTAGGFRWKAASRLNKGSITAYTSNGEVVATFANLDAIRDATNLRTGHVLAAIRGERKMVGGLYWA